MATGANWVLRDYHAVKRVGLGRCKPITLGGHRHSSAPLHWNGDARSGHSTTGWLRFLNHLPWQCYHFGGSGKSFYGESAALLNLCVSRLVALSNHCLVDFPSFCILSRRNIMKHYPTYMAWGIFWAIRITVHRNLLATSNSASWGTCCDWLTSELRYFNTLTFLQTHIVQAPTKLTKVVIDWLYFAALGLEIDVLNLAIYSTINNIMLK